VDKYFENALARIKNCCPPEGFDDWYLNGETDHNGLGIWQPYFHSCGTENWNSQQKSFVVGGNSKKETATALFYEGNAKLITKRRFALTLTLAPTLTRTRTQTLSSYSNSNSNSCTGEQRPAGGFGHVQPDSGTALQCVGGRWLFDTVYSTVLTSALLRCI
jgi:hypothetical protein